MWEYFLDLMPTNFSRLIFLATITIGVFITYFFDEFVSLMPYTLKADVALAKILVIVLIFSVGSLIILCHMIKEHNRLTAEIKELEFNNFINRR